MILKLIIIILLNHCYTSKSEKTNELDRKIKSEINLDSNLVEKIVVDINNDNELDTIKLLDKPHYDDPGEFEKIKIIYSNSKEYTFNSIDAWDFVDSKLLSQEMNIVNSKRILFLNSNKSKFIILFGFGYGSGRSSTILFLNNSEVKQVYNGDLQDFYSISLNKDLSELEINIRKFAIEIYDTKENFSIGTYSPYQIYTVKDTMKLNELKTKEYNEKNYIFLGFEKSNKYKIAYPKDNSKPYILK